MLDLRRFYSQGVYMGAHSTNCYVKLKIQHHIYWGWWTEATGIGFYVVMTKELES